MGAVHKGSKRGTSMRNRRRQVSQLLITALNASTTATFSSKQISTSNFSKYPMSLIIQYLMMFFPHLAPLIYAAYLAYKLTETLILAEKEYRDLKRSLETQEALIKETKRFMIREGLRYIVDEYLIKKIRNNIEGNIAALIASKVFQKMVSNITGREQHNQEKFERMLVITMSQFIVGALTGTTDEVVKEAAKILVES